MNEENIDQESSELTSALEKSAKDQQMEVAEEVSTQANNENIPEVNEYCSAQVMDEETKSNTESDPTSEKLEVEAISTPVKTNNENIPLVKESSIESVHNEQPEINTLEAHEDSISKVNTTSNKQKNLCSGLNMLAQYESDASESEVECVGEVAGPTNPYRNQIVNLDSATDTESDDSSDDSSCCEVEVGKRSFKRLKNTMDKLIADGSDEDENEDDEEGKSQKQRKPPKVKGELLLDDLPPIEDLHITVPENECVELGKVHSIVDQLVLVAALPHSLLVDLDTVLFLNQGKQVLGAVFDVLGQISDPIYCIRFNSNEQIKEKNINIGDVVYVAPKTEYTQFIILSNLLKVRGSDASWENDIEPPPRYLDYSDDEQERLARARARNKDRRPEGELVSQEKRTCESEDSNASASTSTSQRSAHAQSRRGSGRARGWGRSNAFPSSRGQIRPHTGSWHSNYYQRPPPPPMFYGGNPMRPMPPYGPHIPNWATAYPPNSSYTFESPRFPANTAPPPPGTTHDENNYL